MKTIKLVDIINSVSATSPKLANIAYDYLAKAISNGESVFLSFEGIEDFTSAFSNAFIGRLYINFSSEVLNVSLIIQNIQNEIWKKKISDSILLGTNENIRGIRKKNLEELLS